MTESNTDFRCPLCKTLTRYHQHEERLPFQTEPIVSHAWACPTCHWTELLSTEGADQPNPSPRAIGYTGEFRVHLAMFVQNAEENHFPPDAQAAIPAWVKQVRNIRTQERRIRRMVGLESHKPTTDIDERFDKLAKKVKK